MDPRSPLLDQAQSDGPWDVLVIGGGASGLATAWDAASRGYHTALIEKHDFAEATSSRSTKLIHGGVRYLQKGEISLVREALAERSRLLKNAPEFCHPLRFVLPTDAPLARYYYRFGLWLYDLMAGDQSVQPAELLSSDDVRKTLAGYNATDNRGGVSYTDAQFDDAALAIAMAQCINASSNGLAINHTEATRFITENDQVRGVEARCTESGKSWSMLAKVVINATGIFSDEVRKANSTSIQWKMQTSRGSHIVCPGHLLESDHGLIIPKTSDGRILFAIPWLGHTLIGTTDEPTDQPELDPQPSEAELDFLFKEAGQAFHLDPNTVTSQWAGLRPLVSKAGVSNTAKLSRKHIVEIAPNGLISLLGGKWTTSRAMAEDTIDAAIKQQMLPPKPCRTADLKLTDHGALPPFLQPDKSATPEELAAIARNAIETTYARKPDDVLKRRLRIGMLNDQLAQQWQPHITSGFASLEK
ncbi:glycerol-3-phosphate dehydrogenase [Oceaniferula spumae]|uniref:Glycerol-3-phosphate dehydrogenase n=1 Tax=Oceaniferula spumae TaxID=2979115 RepID=A0AAT9FIC0_9BACT